MANVLVERTYFEEIANAIREKNGLFNTYTPAEMANAILEIETGGGGEYSIPQKEQEVLIFPKSVISARMIYEKTLSKYKTLDII